MLDYSGTRQAISALAAYLTSSWAAKLDSVYTWLNTIQSGWADW